MSNLSLIIGLPIGIFGFLFLFWKRLREDYITDEIFSVGFLIIIGLLVGFFLGIFLKDKVQSTIIFNSSGLWFWLSFVLGSIMFVLSFLQFKIRFFETLEAAGLGFLFWFFAIILINSLQIINVKLLFFGVFVFALIAFFYFVDNRYKTFNWYKSGKVGFAGLSSLSIFFLVRSLVALIDPTMLSFIGKLDAVISSIISFIFFISLYNLSRNGN